MHSRKLLICPFAAPWPLSQPPLLLHCRLFPWSRCWWSFWRRRGGFWDSQCYSHCNVLCSFTRSLGESIVFQRIFDRRLGTSLRPRREDPEHDYEQKCENDWSLESVRSWKGLLKNWCNVVVHAWWFAATQLGSLGGFWGHFGFWCVGLREWKSECWSVKDVLAKTLSYNSQAVRRRNDLWTFHSPKEIRSFWAA